MSGVCSCGHIQTLHKAQIHRKYGVVVPHHGKCGVEDCTCQQFTWVREG